jgi:hypothetical protein
MVDPANAHEPAAMAREIAADVVSSDLRHPRTLTGGCRMLRPLTIHARQAPPRSPTE